MPENRAGLALRALSGVLVTALAAVLAVAVMDLPDRPGGLTSQAAEAMPLSGVTHPVTAVLLNFRAYDTWLEVGVLLVAVMGLFVVLRAGDLASAPIVPGVEPVLLWQVRLLVPIAIVVSGYLLWLGSHAPGGAFQAGAVLGASGVLLRLAGFSSIAAVTGWPLRALAVSGFLVFLAVAIGVLAAGRHFLEYPRDWAGRLILLIEVAATIGIGVTLAALFTGGAPAGRRDA